jgi:DNA-binding protein HU-beta
MNKAELINAMAEHAGLSKTDAGKALDGLITSIQTALQNNDSVALVGFGTFEVKDRPERKGRNPQTGVEITIAASKAPGFKPGKGLKDGIAG